jgi:sugar lactone lactonase YvrE
MIHAVPTRVDFAGLALRTFRGADMLGEGPLWHPIRKRLFWFDITGRRLRWLDPESACDGAIELPEMCSAAAWMAGEALLVAGESGLHRLETGSGTMRRVAAFPHADPRLRGNDGRCDPWGRFWIGTMGRAAEPALGALYRYNPGGDLEILRRGITVPNSLAFSPDRRRAYFADSPERVIRVLDLDAGSGAVLGERVFARIAPPAVPDGSAVDAAGFLWNAEWDGGRVVRYDPEGGVDRVVPLPVPRPTCPAFGGDGLCTLFVTTARWGLSDAALSAAPLSGCLFAAPVEVEGQPEHGLAGEG